MICFLNDRRTPPTPKILNRLNWDNTIGPAGQNAHKILNRVNYGNNFAKWGKSDEILLNWVISVKCQIGGKNRNLLKI